jgi:hypothetical protein
MSDPLPIGTLDPRYRLVLMVIRSYGRGVSDDTQALFMELAAGWHAERRTAMLRAPPQAIVVQ